MGVGGQRHAPAALPPGKRHGTQCTEGCVGLGTCWAGWGKISLPPLGFDPPARPVRRY